VAVSFSGHALLPPPLTRFHFSLSSFFFFYFWLFLPAIFCVSDAFLAQSDGPKWWGERGEVFLCVSTGFIGPYAKPKRQWLAISKLGQV